MALQYLGISIVVACGGCCCCIIQSAGFYMGFIRHARFNSAPLYGF
jgi:hypothetical protein